MIAIGATINLKCMLKCKRKQVLGFNLRRNTWFELLLDVYYVLFMLPQTSQSLNNPMVEWFMIPPATSWILMVWKLPINTDEEKEVEMKS